MQTVVILSPEEYEAIKTKADSYDNIHPIEASVNATELELNLLRDFIRYVAGCNTVAGSPNERKNVIAAQCNLMIRQFNDFHPKWNIAYNGDNLGAYTKRK